MLDRWQVSAVWLLVL